MAVFLIKRKELMSSLLDKKAGIFNNAQQYAITNILDEDFNGTWDGDVFSIPKGETVEVPMYLADSVLTQIVDKILMAEMKANEVAYYEKNPNTEINRYRAPNWLGNANKRKEIEAKICKPLELKQGSTKMQLLRMQIRQQLKHDMEQQPSTEPVPVPVSAVGSFSADSMKEFAELGKDEPQPKKEIKVKTLK